MQKKLLIFFASNTQYKHYVYILFPSKWYELLCVYWYGVATWNCLVSSWFSRQYYRKRYCYYTQVFLPCWQWRYIYEIERNFINLLFKGIFFLYTVWYYYVLLLGTDVLDRTWVSLHKLQLRDCITYILPFMIKRVSSSWII